MAKTQDIKRRIRSVRNTMQLTRAMKMVAAAKLRRAQERILNARPYSLQASTILRSLAARSTPEDHPLLQVHEGNRVELVVVSADKGLCGAFNSGIIRTAEAFAGGQAAAEISFNTVGKKGREYFSRRYDVKHQRVDVFRDITFALAREIAGELMQRYRERKVDRIHLIYNEFKSAIQAQPIVQQLLPIEAEEFETGEAAGEYLFEPSADALFSALLPHYVESQVFRALLESAAAEHAARMTAMDSATTNAGELIESLTLTMNRVRQSAITTEIIEVVSGAEALG